MSNDTYIFLKVTHIYVVLWCKVEGDMYIIQVEIE